MLPTYDAVRFLKVLESGRTRPVLLECELTDDEGVSVGTFVVKAPGLPEVEDYGLFAETLGYLVAAELGIETPNAVLVRIDDSFVAAVNPVLQRQELVLQPGLGFGSEHLGSGLIPATADKYLNAEQIEAALKIFCYDLLIHNYDRLETNPNCLIKGGRIVAFDYNAAFSFLLAIGNVNEPWEVSKHQIAEKHLFYRALKGKEIDFKPFIQAVNDLSVQRLNAVLEEIPFGGGRWNDNIHEHFEAIKKNASKLEIEFARCLI
ncbi:MAG TPA: hypothetical protein DEA22_10185 [Blastocatellia bacterium]|nr:hypothetical protein [Blastocatellia bacterium]